MDEIVVSDFKVLNGIFMAISYHKNLLTYRLVYDNDRKVAVSHVGKVAKSILEYKVDDANIAKIYGTNVSDALIEFSNR